MEILLATANLHKLREFRDMFKSLTHIELISLHQFTAYCPPEETGATFKENAILKAEHAAIHLNRWVVADDSGLVVPAIRGPSGSPLRPLCRRRGDRSGKPSKTPRGNEASERS